MTRTQWHYMWLQNSPDGWQNPEGTLGPERDVGAVIVQAGLDGWELAAVEGTDDDATYYFKMPAPPE